METTDRSIQEEQERLAKVVDRVKAGEDQDLSGKVREYGERLVHLLAGLYRLTRLHDSRNDAFIEPLRDLADVFKGLHQALGIVQLVAVDDQVWLNDLRLRFESHDTAPGLVASLLLRHGTGGLDVHSALDAAQVRALLMFLVADPPPAAARATLQKTLEENNLSAVVLLPKFRHRTGAGAEDGVKSFDIPSLARRCVVAAMALWDGLALGRSADPLPVRRRVNDLVEADQPTHDSLLLALQDESEGPAHARHSATVASLSISIGRTIGLSPSTLSDLGVAAFFHDTGYVSGSKESPTPMHRHGIEGARMVLRQRGFHEARVRRLLVCLHHHRKASDARGVAALARIVKVADDYDTMTRARPNGAKMPRPEGIARIMAAAGTHYDEVAARALVNRLGPFPPGTRLRLEDNRVVRVRSGVRSPELFATPEVEVLREADGRHAPPGQVLDLAWEGRVAAYLR
ncbi:MAG: HD domain-containing protein [Polyangiales bacterium]